MSVLQPAISDAALESLSGLLRDKRPAYLRGLMTAIVTGPARLPDRDAIDTLFAALDLTLGQAANDALPSLRALIDETRALQESGDFSLGNDTPFSELVAWCQGYLEGMQQDKAWLADKSSLLFVLPISAIAQAEELNAPSTKKLEQCIERIPFVVPSLYRYWGDRRDKG